MKYCSLFFLTLLFSCGKYDSDTTRELIGESRSATALSVSSTDRNNLTSICSALSEKATTLPLPSGPYTYATRQTDCQNNVLVDTDVSVTIDTSFLLKKTTDNQDYIFPLAETNTSGLLADICGDLSLFVNPQVASDGSTATWITTLGITSNHCSAASGELCVQVEKGILNGDNSYTIHTKEWMRVRVSSTLGKLGFFTVRKRLTQASCAANESQVAEASLI